MSADRMAQRELTIAKALYTLSLGAFKMGAMMTRLEGVPPSVLHQIGLIPPFINENGVDMAADTISAQWEELNALIDSGASATAVGTKDGAVAMSRQLMAQLFSQAEIVDALMGSATAKEDGEHV